MTRGDPSSGPRLWVFGLAQLWFVATLSFVVATLSPGLFADPPSWVPWTALGLVLAGPCALGIFGGSRGRRLALSVVLLLLANACALVAATMFVADDLTFGVLAAVGCLAFLVAACAMGRSARGAATSEESGA